MSYFVQLDEAARRKLVGWKLPHAVMRALLDRIDELSHGPPSRHLIRVEASTHTMQCDLTVQDPGPPPKDYFIVLFVRYATDEETLLIVDCERLVEDRPM